jgi:branched-chain amino acid transport system permease protein
MRDAVNKPNKLRKLISQMSKLNNVSIGLYDIDMLYVVILVFAGLLPFTGLLPPSIVQSSAIVFMYIALAQAWNIIGGVSGYPDFATVAYFGLGAYTVGIGQARFGLSFLVCLMLAFLLMLSIGIIISPVMKGDRPFYFAFTTLLLFVVVENVLYLWDPVRGFTQGVSGWPVSAEFSTTDLYLIMLILMVSFSLFVMVFKQTKVGYGLLTIKESNDIARSLGVNIKRYRVIAMSLYCGFVGVTGAFYSTLVGWVSTDVVLGLETTLIPITIVMAAGLGKVRRVLIAGLLILFGREAINRVFPEYSTAVFGGFIVVLALLLAKDVGSGMFQRFTRPTVSTSGSDQGDTQI